MTGRGVSFNQIRQNKALLADIAVILAVLVLSVLSWRMISDVATAVYRQTAPLGDPPLQVMSVPGPDPDPQASRTGRHPSSLGHYGYFWSERAFHYRTTLMFTGQKGQDPGLLAHDTWQQHPDGVDAWREYTLLMEPVYGWLYRALGDQSRPPVEFLLGLIPLIHVLLIPLLFAACRGLGVGRLASLGAVAFYSGCTLGFQRLTGSLLLKEDFALLFLMIFLACHIWSQRRPRWGLPLAAAAAALVVFLASWHLSQFLALAVLGTAALWHVGSENSDRRIPVVYLVAGVIAGLTPSLWARGFLLGPLMAVLVAWLGAVLLVHDSSRRRLGAFVLLAVVLGGLSLFNRLFSGDYSHVLGLLVEKIRHGFVRPDDPGSLPFAVRIFWAPPFNTPTLAEIQAKMGWNIFWVPVVALWSMIALARGRARGPAAGLLACQLVMLAGYLLIERLGVVFLVFESIAVALLAADFQHWLASRRWKASTAGIATLILVLVAPTLNLKGNLAPMRHISRDLRQGRGVKLGATDQATWVDATQMMQWITRNTPGPGSTMPGKPGAFLAEVGLSPQLLLYCRRPMALNSQFENTEIRSRYQRFLTLLYGRDEQALADFAQDLDVQYIVINRSMASFDGPGSLSWIAGFSGFLDRDMIVTKMQFHPRDLKRLHPVFDNPQYRVFALDGAAVGHIVRSYSCWWNPQQFTIEKGELTDLPGDRMRLQTFLEAMSDLQDRQQRILAGVEGRRRNGRQLDLMSLQRQYVQARLGALTQSPEIADKSADLAGRLANAVAAIMSEIEPATGKPLQEALGDLVGSAARPRQGFLGWFAVNQGEPLHHAAAGQLLALAGRYAEAAEQFRVAADFFNDPQTGAWPRDPEPMVRQLWLERAWWTFASGQVDQAAAMAHSYLAQMPTSSPGDEVAAMLRRIGAAASTSN